MGARAFFHAGLVGSMFLEPHMIQKYKGTYGLGIAVWYDAINFNFTDVGSLANSRETDFLCHFYILLNWAVTCNNPEVTVQICTIKRP
jgi:hypothetical protein